MKFLKLKIDFINEFLNNTNNTMTEVDMTSFQNISSQFSEEIISMIQKDTARKILNYLQYKPSKVDSIISTLGFATEEISNDYVVENPRSDTVNKSQKIEKTDKKAKKTSKKEKTAPTKKSSASNIQIAYRAFMATNTNIDNKNGIKYKLMQQFPNMSKRELHTTALKEISLKWKNMSAEEKNSSDDKEQYNQLKKEKTTQPVEISSSEGSEVDDEDTACEEISFGGKSYAVEIGSEPRSVYTLDGIEVGTFTEENGIQLF